MSGTFGESFLSVLWLQPAHQVKSHGWSFSAWCPCFLPLDLEGNPWTPQHGDLGFPRFDAPAIHWSGRLNAVTAAQGVPEVCPAQDRAIRGQTGSSCFLLLALWDSCGVAGDGWPGIGEQGSPSLSREQHWASPAGFLCQALQELSGTGWRVKGSL